MGGKDRIYALHVLEERYHQAHDWLQRARQALPPGNAAHAHIESALVIVDRDWEVARQRIDAAQAGSEPADEPLSDQPE